MYTAHRNAPFDETINEIKSYSKRSTAAFPSPTGLTLEAMNNILICASADENIDSFENTMVRCVGAQCVTVVLIIDVCMDIVRAHV